MPTLPPEVTLRMEVVEEEAILKGSNVPEPWRLKLMVEDVALTPKAVPLSIRVEVARVVAPVQRVA